MARIRSFDIRENQIIENFPDDENFTYHHRVLLRRIGDGSVWVALTPDGDLRIVDLAVIKHHPVSRNAAFPARYANDVYAFDPLRRVELLEAHERAKVQARILAKEADDDGADSEIWIVVGPPSL